MANAVGTIQMWDFLREAMGSTVCTYTNKEKIGANTIFTQSSHPPKFEPCNCPLYGRKAPR